MLCAALTLPVNRYCSSDVTSPAKSRTYAFSMRGVCSDAYALFCLPVAKYTMTYTVVKISPISYVIATARFICAFIAL